MTNLEREIALFTSSLIRRRLAKADLAVYYNSLVTRRPRLGLENRIDDLIEEIRQW